MFASAAMYPQYTNLILIPLVYMSISSYGITLDVFLYKGMRVKSVKYAYSSGFNPVFWIRKPVQIIFERKVSYS